MRAAGRQSRDLASKRTQGVSKVAAGAGRGGFGMPCHRQNGPVICVDRLPMTFPTELRRVRERNHILSDGGQVEGDLTLDNNGAAG